MPLQVKICGLSTPETLDAAIKGGASHVGFVFFDKSPRSVCIDDANALQINVPDHVKIVAVLVDAQEEFLSQLLGSTRVDVLQLHGHEDSRRAAHLKARYKKEIWKAVPVRTMHDVTLAHAFGQEVDRVVYDAKPSANERLPGGNGLRFDWTLIEGHRHQRNWALSGGLDAENLAEAVRITGAPLVDVSSGVESAPGVKDVDKIAAFLKAAASL